MANDRLGAFVSPKAEIRKTVIHFRSEMSNKINVDPVLRLQENNHDFCETKKEIKVLCIERSAIITRSI